MYLTKDDLSNSCFILGTLGGGRVSLKTCFISINLGYYKYKIFVS